MVGHHSFSAQPSAGARAHDQANIEALEALHDAWPLLYEGGTDDLAGIRARCGVNQVDLAERLEISQPAVSRIENSPNPTVGKVADYVAALGGRLHFIVQLPNGELLPLDIITPLPHSDPTTPT